MCPRSQPAGSSAASARAPAARLRGPTRAPASARAPRSTRPVPAPCLWEVKWSSQLRARQTVAGHSRTSRAKREPLHALRASGAGRRPRCARRRSSARGPGGRARGRAREMPPVDRPIRPPALGSRPTQRAPSTRRRWPCENTTASASSRRSSSITRSARSPTSAASSPPGHPSRQRLQPGRRCVDLLAREPLVVAVVPLHQVFAQACALAEPAQLARFPRAQQRAGEHRLETASRQARRSARAAARPPSVSGRSVLPVCLPCTLHSVSAWRTSTTCGSGARPVRPCAAAGGGSVLVTDSGCSGLRGATLEPRGAEPTLRCARCMRTFPRRPAPRARGRSARRAGAVGAGRWGA